MYHNFYFVNMSLLTSDGDVWNNSLEGRDAVNCYQKDCHFESATELSCLSGKQAKN